MGCRIFISHSTPDLEVVQAICERAREVSVEPYIFEHDHQPGRQVADKLKEQINQSDALVVLLTPRSATAPYVHQEIGFAIRAGKPVIPLVEQGTSSSALAMLVGVEYIVIDPSQPTQGLTILTQTLAKLRERKQLKADAELAVALLAAVLIIVLVSQER